MISHRGIGVRIHSQHKQRRRGNLDDHVPSGEGRYLSCSPFILFLTELHRRKDFTKVHRDIKSTDSTERYSYCWVLDDRC